MEFCRIAIFIHLFAIGYSLYSGSELLIEYFSIYFFIVLPFLIIIFHRSLAWIFFAPWTIITIDRRNKMVKICEYRFYERRVQKYYFHQIKKFKSHFRKSRIYSKYFLSLVLANQKEIKLRIVASEDKNTTVRFIKNLNRYVKAGQDECESEIG